MVLDVAEEDIARCVCLGQTNERGTNTTQQQQDAITIAEDSLATLLHHQKPPNENEYKQHIDNIGKLTRDQRMAFVDRVPLPMLQQRLFRDDWQQIRDTLYDTCLILLRNLVDLMKSTWTSEKRLMRALDMVLEAAPDKVSMQALVVNSSFSPLFKEPHFSCVCILISCCRPRH